MLQKLPDYRRRMESVALISGIMGMYCFFQGRDFDEGVAGTMLMVHGAFLAACAFGFVAYNAYKDVQEAQESVGYLESGISFLPVLSAAISGVSFFLEIQYPLHVMLGMLMTYFPMCFYIPLVRLPEGYCALPKP